jgi:carboxymethylenebutenolidase
MAFRNLRTEMVTYRGHNGDRGEAYYARPEGAGPFPGVVIVHHMPGWDEWTCEVAHKLAHHGYASIAPSLYFRVGDGAREEVVAKVRGEGGVPTIRCAATSRARWNTCAPSRTPAAKSG